MKPAPKRHGARRPERLSPVLGRRLREARLEQNLTLKKVEESSGFSATHISEIERGRTSPTIGALVDIAAALGKDIGFFLDAESREVAAWRRGGVRPGLEVQVAASVVLSAGVAGGVLDARRIDLPPGGRSDLGPGGETCAYVLSGRVALETTGRSVELETGDAVHAAPDSRRVVRAVGESAASVLVVASGAAG